MYGTPENTVVSYSGGFRSGDRVNEQRSERTNALHHFYILLLEKNNNWSLLLLPTQTFQHSDLAGGLFFRTFRYDIAENRSSDLTDI